MDYYSPDYQTARRRFLAAADDAGAVCASYALDAVDGDTAETDALSVDIAEIGSGSPLVIVSSGLHGVEGFFGSAVQLALLNRQAELPCRLLLIHAINPWGFQYLRRADAHNVDLNRNFRASFDGCPAGYHQLNRFLNPTDLPSPAEAFRLRAAFKILRYGMSALKESVASGQYEYPAGLFYGGAQISDSAQLISRHYRRWVSSADKVLHVDLHTGLGAYGELRLLCNRDESADNIHWFRQTFGSEQVESLSAADGTAYPVEGQMGQWLQTLCSDIDFRFVGAEYGTYSPLCVLQALRAENRFHFYGDAQSAAFKKAKHNLLECFCPQDQRWRKQVLDSAVATVMRGASALV